MEDFDVIKFLRLGALVILGVLGAFILVRFGITELPRIVWGIPQTISDIAFDVNSDYGYTVYIEELDGYHPYLVLTDDYNGNCLLLRRHPFGKPIRYSEEWRGLIPPSYYEDSSIDKYLNSVYLDSIQSISDMVVDSEIVITHVEAIVLGHMETTTITRKAFLLSQEEIMLHRWKDSTYVKEGSTLKYFEQDSILSYFRLICRTENGIAVNWWLRTPYISPISPTLIFVVTANAITGPAGNMGTGGPTYNNLRPAICVPGDTPLYEMQLDKIGRVYAIAD